jgi:glucokinase
MSQTKFALGVDIGGTHITAAVIDLHEKRIVPFSVKRDAVNAAGSADEIIDAWSHCMQQAKADRETESICIAMPGPFDYNEGISHMRGQGKYESLFNLNVKEYLSRAINFPADAIFMANDAACFLQGEVYAGAVHSFSNSSVIGITLGTGLGSAIYRNGVSRSADMWCWPFKESIVEEYLSTRWFVQRWKALTGEEVAGVRELIMLPAGDKNVTAVFDSFAENLSRFLLDFIAQEKPAAIVVGGNISRAFNRFGDKVESDIRLHYPNIKLKCALRGEEAPLLGAVSNWLTLASTTR